MVLYYCDRCGYSTNHKNRFRQHIYRKNTCINKMNNIDIELVRQKYGIVKLENNSIVKLSNDIHNNSKENNLENITYSCEYCLYKFNKKYNLYRHYDRCKKKQSMIVNDNNTNIKQRLYELERKTEVINNTINNVTISNNIDNSNNHNSIILIIMERRIYLI